MLKYLSQNSGETQVFVYAAVIQAAKHTLVLSFIVSLFLWSNAK